MKRLFEFRRTALFYMLVCFAVVANAATRAAAVTEKTTNLFTGEVICADDWSAGFQKFDAAVFANASKGDKIVVTVSAVSSSCSHPQVYLQKGNWTNFDPNQSAHVTEPGKVEFTINADMLTEIKSSGLVVKGCGYTFTSVDLITYIESGDTKAIAVSLPIWTCNTTCPDNWGNSEYIPADKFRMVTSGAMLKVHVTAVSPTAQWPQARLNTKGYKKMSESTAISDVNRDYSLLIPDDMLDEIRTNGVRVGGGGYTFDRVTLVTDVNVLTEAHETLQLYPDYDNSYIREFKTGEKPQLAFSFVNPEATAQDVNLVITLTRDNGTAVNTYTRDITVEASDGTNATIDPCAIDLSQDITEARVYHFTATYNGNTLCSYNIAYNLEGINCPADSKSDFKQFWDNALAELAAVTPEYTIEEYTDGKADTDLRTIYKVTMKSTPNVIGEDPVTVAGFLAVPKGEESVKHPVIITYQGTDNGTGKLNVPSRTASGEFIDFVFSTRGQQLCRDDQHTYYPEGKTSPDYYAYGLGDSHKHYYYGGNLDCARAVDFLCSDLAAQYGVDKDNIFAAGGSQGGSFCYAAAFLGGGRVKAIAPSITGHSDFRHNTECVGWPKNVFQNFLDNNTDWTWDKLFDFLSYYDVKNFAPYITCPVITNFSLQDTTDPTHTNIAPYLLLTQVDAADKAYSLNNFNGHAAAADFSTTYTAFFKKYLTGYEQGGGNEEGGEEENNGNKIVWSGEKVMPSDWTAYVVIAASEFTNAVVGYELRLHHKNVRAGAQVSPRGSDWNMLPGSEAKAPEGAYTKYTITEEMLASLQSGGCIIGGCNYTLTSVEIVDPANIKTLTINVPVTDNRVYSDGNVTIKVEIKNDNEEDVAANAELRVTTDKFIDYKSLSQTADVKAGESVELTFTFEAEPGFYHVTALVNDETAGAFNIGVDPTEIVSPTDKQSDFDELWAAAKAELATVAIDATFTKIEEKSTAKRNVWLVEMNSIADSKNGEPAIIRGYYAEPVAEGKYPAIVHYQGYDSGYDPYCPDGNGNADFCELYLSTRGQLINNREPYENTYGDWFQFNFGNKDTYYYRGAYMDVLRAIDFLCSRDKVDSNNLFAEGASQGGAFTYAAAALSDRKLNAIAPAIPFMGDFPDYFEVGSWPAYPAHQQQAALGLSDEEMFAFLSYFDTKNLATRISSPVMSCIGLQDDVCPPHTNIAPYNNLPEGVEKTLTFNPELKHQTANNWYDNYMAFFKSHLTTTGINTLTSDKANLNGERYNLNGQKVAKSFKGLVIMNGKVFNQK